jgi:raffinose/stachyose/melibiose transport system substrate-binding protein
MKRSRTATLASAVLVGSMLLPGSLPALAQETEASGECTGGTVTLWSWFVQSTMGKAIDAYVAENPEVDVQYTYYNYSPEYLTALKTGSQSGTLPDLIGLQPGSLTQQYRDDLVPLNDYAAAAWGEGWEDAVFDANKVQMRLGNPEGDDGYYILPHYSQVLATWYNRPVFEELGLSVPTTLDELVAVSRTLRENGYLPMFQGAKAHWQNENVFLILANQLNPGITDAAQRGEAKWTDPDVLEAMRVWGDLFTNGVFQDGALGAEGYPTGADLFRAGRVGMVTFGSWWLQESQAPPPRAPLTEDLVGYDFFLFPAIREGAEPGGIVGGIDIGYGMTKAGAENPCAFDFLASLLRGTAAQGALVDVNNIPAYEGIEIPSTAGPNVTRLYNEFMELLPQAVNQRWYSPIVQDAMDTALQAVAAGTQAPEDAVAAIQEAQDKALAAS